MFNPSLGVALTIVLLALWPSDGDKYRLGGVDPVELATVQSQANVGSSIGEQSQETSTSEKHSRAFELPEFLQQLRDRVESELVLKFHQTYAPPENGRDTNDSITTETSPLGDRSRSPVLLLPGYGGSQLEANWSRPQVEHYFCKKDSPGTTIWVDIKLMLPYMIDCLVGIFKLNFDPATNTTHDAEGVHVQVKEPDNLFTVEYLNDLHIPSFGYFAALTSHLIKNFGYRREENLRGAPYDFRKAPNELVDYFIQLRHTSELMFQESNGKQVTFICHSMGCNNVLHFLQKQSQNWKDKHVKRVISIAAPWGGSVAALRAVALGDNLGMPFLYDERKLNVVQRSLPSTIYMVPHRRVFGRTPLIISNVDPASGQKRQIYEAQDYMQFFQDINHPDGYRMWLQTKDLLANLEPPRVEVWCLYGEGRQTLGRLEYRGSFPNSEEMILYDDGDGTVTTQSSKFCLEWSKQQTQPVHLKGFQASHIEMMSNEEVLEFIEDIMNNEDDLCEPKKM